MFIWLFPFLLVLISANPSNTDDFLCGNKPLRKFGVTITGLKKRLGKIPNHEKSALIVVSGSNCHDCVKFVLAEMNEHQYEWFILYLWDGSSELNTADMRETISMLKRSLRKSAIALDDQHVYFMHRSLFCTDLNEFPLVLTGNLTWISYSQIWEAMEAKSHLSQLGS